MQLATLICIFSAISPCATLKMGIPGSLAQSEIDEAAARATSDWSGLLEMHMEVQSHHSQLEDTTNDITDDDIINGRGDLDILAELEGLNKVEIKDGVDLFDDGRDSTIAYLKTAVSEEKLDDETDDDEELPEVTKVVKKKVEEKTKVIDKLKNTQKETEVGSLEQDPIDRGKFAGEITNPDIPNYAGTKGVPTKAFTKPAWWPNSVPFHPPKPPPRMQPIANPLRAQTAQIPGGNRFNPIAQDSDDIKLRRWQFGSGETAKEQKAGARRGRRGGGQNNGGAFDGGKAGLSFSKQ